MNWGVIGAFSALLVWQCFETRWDLAFGVKSLWFTAWLILWAATVILFADKMRRRRVRFGDKAAYYSYWGGFIFLSILCLGPFTWLVMQMLHARLQ